jgi:hypothetical protein
VGEERRAWQPKPCRGLLGGPRAPGAVFPPGVSERSPWGVHPHPTPTLSLRARIVLQVEAWKNHITSHPTPSQWQGGLQS